MAGRLNFLLLILFCNNFTAFCDERDLYKALMEHCIKNNKVRPRTDHNEPVDVHVSFELVKIISVDEIGQIMTSVGFFVAEWKDDHIAWGPATFGGLESIVLPPTTIWLPDFGLANSVGKFYQTTFFRDFRVRVHHDGRVMWSFGGEISTVCTLDMTFYPFDLQTCEIQIENWAYTGAEVNLTNKKDEVALDAYEPNGVWNVVETFASTDHHKYEATGEVEYPEVKFVLYMQRKAMFYILNLIVPCALIIIVALAVYWLPADSGEKVSLGVTVLLAFSVFQLVIADSTPVNSDFTPILSRMVISIMSLSSVSVLTAIWVLYLHHKDSSRVVPACIKSFAFKGLARILCMQSSIPEQAPPKKQRNMPTTIDILVDDEMNSSDEYKLNNDETNNFSSPLLSKILDNLSYITDSMKDKETEQVVMAEWRAVAKILDRFLFYLTFIIILIIMVVLVMQQDPDH